MTEILPKTSSEESESLGNVAKEIHAEAEHKMTQKEIDDKRKTAKQLEHSNYGIYNVGDAFDFLLKKGQAGENIVMSFNGTKLYSFGVETEDDLYMQYFGRTKIEQEKYVEKARQEYEAKEKKEELEALEKIPGWMEEGKKYIDESKWEDWEKYIKISAKDIYHGKDVDATLELLKLIDAGESWEKVQKAFDDQGHSNLSYSVVFNRVVYFSKKGEEAKNKLTKYW